MEAQGAGNAATGVWTQATTLVTATLAGQIAGRQVLRYASYVWDAESAYQYCEGDPVNFSDPEGAWAKSRAVKNVPKVPQYREGDCIDACIVSVILAISKDDPNVKSLSQYGMRDKVQAVQRQRLRRQGGDIMPTLEYYGVDNATRWNHPACDDKPWRLVRDWVRGQMPLVMCVRGENVYGFDKDGEPTPGRHHMVVYRAMMDDKRRKYVQLMDPLTASGGLGKGSRPVVRWGRNGDNFAHNPTRHGGWQMRYLIQCDG